MYKAFVATYAIHVFLHKILMYRGVKLGIKDIGPKTLLNGRSRVLQQYGIFGSVDVRNVLKE